MSFWSEELFLKQTGEDRQKVLKIYKYIIPLLIFILFWDIYQLNVKISWHYILVKGLTVGSVIVSMMMAYLNKSINWAVVWSLLSLFVYSFYGMLALDFTYCYSFWEIYFATSFFFRLSKKMHFLLMTFGGALNLIALKLVSEPTFMKEGLSFKPHMAIVSGIIFLLSNLLFYVVTKKQEEIFELQDRFAMIGKQSSYVFHEIKKPIKRLMSSESFVNSDIQQINNILLNIELMLKNPENFKQSFVHCDLRKIFSKLEVEFEDYFKEFNIVFASPDIEKKIYANEGLIYQVFKNLTVNSIEAIIQSNDNEVERSIVVNYATSSNGKSVEIRFQNSGSHILKEVSANVFEPFFSTKKGGTNNGLGLSFCKNIVEGHGGTIHLTHLKSGPEFVVVL